MCPEGLKCTHHNKRELQYNTLVQSELSYGSSNCDYSLLRVLDMSYRYEDNIRHNYVSLHSGQCNFQGVNH